MPLATSVICSAGSAPEGAVQLGATAVPVVPVEPVVVPPVELVVAAPPVLLAEDAPLVPAVLLALDDELPELELETSVCAVPMQVPPGPQ
jgi:hypothetical protein